MENNEAASVDQLITESLMHSYWEQASRYMISNLSMDSSEQIDYIQRECPEYLVGYSKWMARQYDQYVIDTNFAYYGEMDNIVKAIMTDVEIQNRPFFKELRLQLHEACVDRTEYEKDYIYKTLTRSLTAYFRGEHQEMEYIKRFLKTPFDNFRNLNKLDEEVITCIMLSYEVDEARLRPIILLIDWFIADINVDQRNILDGFIYRNNQDDWPLDILNHIPLGPNLDRNRFLNIIEH